MNQVVNIQQELIEDFQVFDNWLDRYQYIIDLGKKLPPFPEELKTEENRLHGCQSQVWLKGNPNGATLDFQATSDSAIVAGLIALLLRVYSGQPAAEIIATPPDFISAIGLNEHLSPTRSNGLHAMISAIREQAEQCSA
jgi:cysteine desulfuration protein SufE